MTSKCIFSTIPPPMRDTVHCSQKVVVKWYAWWKTLFLAALCLVMWRGSGKVPEFAHFLPILDDFILICNDLPSLFC